VDKGLELIAQSQNCASLRCSLHSDCRTERVEQLTVAQLLRKFPFFFCKIHSVTASS
jgi:hypothetical protein